MVFFRKVFLLPVLLCFVSAYAHTVVAQQPADSYEQGMKAAEQGNTEEAINTWLQAKGALDVPDTRMGIAFIELVAAEEMNEYYEFATLMYQWGLSAKEVSSNSDALKDEIERLRILTGHKLYKRWWDLWKDNDPQIYNELSAFWNQLDPTPTTAYNERLIEHWQRIAYSREHFTRNKSGVFNADDRAEIYIRYGEPDVIKDGILQFNAGTASSYVERMANTPQVPFPKVGSTLVQTYVRHAQNYHSYPEYELWVYRETSPGTDKKTFIFGSNANTGEYGMMESVEDFIPNLAFSLGRGQVPSSQILGGGSPRIKGIRPGLILQIVYYDQLSTGDIFFGKMFEEITSRAIDPGGVVSASLGQEMKNRAWVELTRQREKAPDQESSHNKQMADIPLNVYQYRLLDEQNRPYFATFVESSPQKAFWIDYLTNYSSTGKRVSRDEMETGSKLKYYQYSKTVQLYNNNGKLEGQISDTPVIVTNQGSVSASLFEIPAIAEGSSQVFSVELQNTDPESEYTVDGLPFKESLRGLGSTTVEQPTPLDNDNTKLQMGDIILGYNYDETGDFGSDFPFTVANDREIALNEDLVVHFEIYNFEKNNKGIYDVKLSYQIKPKEGILGWFKKEEENLKLTLNLESQQPRYVENLQIKTRVLKPGSYVLEVAVIDTESQQKVERNFEFEVVDSN